MAYAATNQYYGATILPHSIQEGEIGKNEILELVLKDMHDPAIAMIAKFLGQIDIEKQKDFLSRCIRLACARTDTSVWRIFLSETVEALVDVKIGCEELHIINAYAPEWWSRRCKKAAVYCTETPILIGYESLIGLRAFAVVYGRPFYIFFPEWVGASHMPFCGYCCLPWNQNFIELLEKRECDGPQSCFPLWKAKAQLLIGHSPSAEGPLLDMARVIWKNVEAPKHILLFRELP